MKETIFAVAVLGTIGFWIVWAILTGDYQFRVKSKQFLAAAIGCTVFAIGWAIIYGA